MNIRLEPINKHNYKKCITMGSSEYMASNILSIVQAYVFDNWYPCCIYHQDTLVGFIMYAIDEYGELWMYRLYIDEVHQNKGYGTAAVKKLLTLVKDKYNCNEFFTSTSPENKRALHVYENIGFKRTGDIMDKEVILRYKYS
ncbi:GNAT family N-acetyltransferase [Oceanirhabdus sp. W0125-5]|uniref:GNAT family N-acetyltransferase n=1 Tax=Oceanirhabdus sp. W0125-5 TaxID=2999116 RepID=UPI0022F32CCB|nr:GNAT family N-acetyltransferase [Oceanirhabdus sp. W0125-5]WBW94701.1 GNAT family N-acetyltransferase [Oceanirhabdus sp. W0125-5]